MRALRRSPQRPSSCAAPGNAGIARDARTSSVGVDDLDGLVAAARDEAVDLVVVGPEAPLVDGLVDALAEAGIAASGRAPRPRGWRAPRPSPRRSWPRPASRRPTTRVVDDASSEGMAAIARYPSVIKADGLAAGKGVVIAAGRGRGARGAATACSSSAASATEPVVVEELLDGRGALAARALRRRARASRWRRRRTTSASSTAIAGPNTGGMGAYSPVPGIDARRGRGDRPHRPPARRRRAARAAARPSTACSTPG